MVTIEVNHQLDATAFEGYSAMLVDFVAHAQVIDRALQYARQHGDAEKISMLSQGLLEAMFAYRTVNHRALQHKRSLQDAEFSKRFWLNVVFS